MAAHGVHANLTNPTRRHYTVLALAGLASGCGFKLRGAQNFAFSSISINAAPASALTQELRRALGATVQVLAAPAAAQVRLEIGSEQREKVVVGMNTSGQVRELQLRERVSFKLSSAKGDVLIAQTTIAQQRDISYNETAALAKEAEEALLYRDMQLDIVQQIMRRLAAVKSLP